MLSAGLLFFFNSCQKNNESLLQSENVKIIVEKNTAGTESQRNGEGPYVLNMVIQLSGDAEVPSANTSAKGVAHLRVTADKKLYSKVNVHKLDQGDTLRFSHIHAAGVGVNGPVRIFLCRTADDFGKNIVTDLTQAQYDLLLNDPTYVNAHSNFFPGGVVRGQIR